jgi:protein-S-isoprenylcysteine O-methyltransferase Ste14
MAGAAEAAAAAAMAAGGVLSASGLGLALWAQATLRATPPGVLVDHGPYAHSRNPLLLGLALALTGAGPALGQPLLALAGPAWLAAAAAWWLPREEAALRARHGGWYSDYAADVRRWL